jgi:hypothetical protein
VTAQVVDGVLYGADDLVGEWINARMGGGKPDVPFVAMGIFSGDRIALGAMFFNQSEADVTMALALEPRGCKPRAMAKIMAYPFVQLGLPRVTAEIPLSNKESIRLAEGFGFVREGVKRRAAPDGGHVGVFGLLKKDFKLRKYWL